MSPIEDRTLVVSVDVEPDVAMFVTGSAGLQDGVPRLEDVFRRLDVRADYYFTLDSAVQIPDFVRSHVREGGWLGCHGLRHTPAYYSREKPMWQTQVVEQATKGLSEIAGVAPVMFRAPNFSISGTLLRALDGAGFIVDSSVLPGRVKRRRRIFSVTDHRRAPREPYHPDGMDPCRRGSLHLWEMPITENPLSPGGPIGLGFLNATDPETAARAVLESTGSIITILCHAWEAVNLGRINPNLPPWLAATCRSDLNGFERFLRALRPRFRFATLREIFSSSAGGGSP